MNKEAEVREYVSVASRFSRSVNLKADFKRNTEKFGYIVTSNVANALEQVFNGLNNKDGQRAFAIFGLYGSGKSAFAIFLTQLLAKDNVISKQASSLLRKNEKYFTKKVFKNIVTLKDNNAFLPVLITARLRPISQLILEGISQSIELLNNTTVLEMLAEQLDNDIKNALWKDTSKILSYMEVLGKEARIQGYQGLLLIVDEAGKTLEYALNDREGGDVYLYQEIAEYANRVSDFSLLFLITLHQQMDDYIELLSRPSRVEWTKVQARFETIQFTESAGSIIQMIAEAIQPTKAAPEKVLEAIKNIVNNMENNAIHLPIGLDRDTFAECAYKAWPLHPCTLLALPHIFSKFAQNERSIFSYLISEEQYGFQALIQKTVNEDFGFIRLKDIYTYLMANYEMSLSRHSLAKKLLETNDIINSRINLSSEEYDLLKTIALLNVLGEVSTLKATVKFLQIAMPNSCDVEEVLNKLKKQSLLTYRRLDSSYRVWEGSDVDIEERIIEARRHLQMESYSFLETLMKYLKMTKLIAKRHSLEKGTLRYFAIEYVDRIERIENIIDAAIESGASGLVLVILPIMELNILQQNAEKLTQSNSKLIIAIPKQFDMLNPIVEEITCLQWVEKNTEELRDDRIARRELNMRLTQAEQWLSIKSQAILEPNPNQYSNSCQWYWKGKNQGLQSSVEVSMLVSKACDFIYSKSSILRNELISRNDISAAASGARRNLLEKMIQNPEQERLNINGYPAERSIYESVLKATQIHVYDEQEGIWRFQPPSKSNIMNLRPCWDLLEHEIFNKSLKKTAIVDIFTKLVKAPYGLPDGVHPILFTAFYLYNQDDLFLYREGTFLPDPQIAHFELLQRRPDLFAVSGVRLEGIRLKVVTRLAEGLKTPIKTSTVVKALFRMINSLPTITLKTSLFEDKAVIKMRDIFLNAQSPEDLLYVDLPLCFGLKPFVNENDSQESIDSFFYQLNNYFQKLSIFAGEQQKKMSYQLLECCTLEKSDEGWLELEKRCELLRPKLTHEILTPFFNSIINGSKDNHNSQPALSYIANRSFEHWSDIDLERFQGLAEGLAGIFNSAWQNYGKMDFELSNLEKQQMKAIRSDFEEQLQKYKSNTSINALCSLLRELLDELEQESKNNKSVDGN